MNDKEMTTNKQFPYVYFLLPFKVIVETLGGKKLRTNMEYGNKLNSNRRHTYDP